MRKTLSGVIIAIVAAAGGALLADVGDAAVRTGAGGLSRAANRRRQARSERHLAGAQRGQLRPRGAHGAAGDGAARRARTVRCRRRRCSRSARSARCRRAWASSKAARFRTSRRRSRKKKENQENWLERDPEIKCYLPGVPRATYMPQPFQILQSPSAIFFAYQYAGAVRNIYLKDPGPAPVDSWMGQSVGTLGRRHARHRRHRLQRQTWFDRAGNFHSEQLHVVERYTRTAPDVITLRGDDRGSEDVHAAVEDQHAALSPAREERAADGLQVRRVRRRADVRPVAEEAADQVASAGEYEFDSRWRSDAAARSSRCAVACWRSPAMRRVDGQAREAGAARPSARFRGLPDGHPDLQGTYDLATLTPVERPARHAAGADRRAGDEARAAGRRAQRAAATRRSTPTAPRRRSAATDRPAPAGNVGGYNNFWLDPARATRSIDGQQARVARRSIRRTAACRR